jgi:mRNA interferase RelE/StbE
MRQIRYQIIILAKAAKEIEALPKQDQKKVIKILDSLAEEPRPPGCKKLVGSPFWRVRSGQYRVIFSIEDKVLTVEVIKVAHRKEVYR